MMKIRSKKIAAFVILVAFVAGVGILLAPYVYAAFSSHVYPDKDVLVARSFEPQDLSTVGSGSVVTATVNVTNSEEDALRGFYYSDQVPNGWTVNTASVSTAGGSVTDYVYEQGYADGIYAGFTPHRWSLELPRGDGVFSPTHPIPAGGTAQIVYTMVVSGSGSDYSTGQDAWAGWLASTVPTGTAVFGYQDVTDFAASPRSGEAPLTVVFTDTSTGEPTAWTWDFGDGSDVNSQQYPAHIYTTPGTYTVTLTVTRTEPTGSDTVVKPNFITVTAPSLQADFTAQPRFGLAPLTVQFTDHSTGDVLTHTWDFGDEGTASLPSPTHTYHYTSYYTVSLTVQNAYSSSTLVRPQYIHVTDEIYNIYLPVILKDHTSA